MRQVFTQTKYALWSLFHREYLQPSYKIATFNDLVVPKNIRLVILDKDNCFTKPQAPTVWPQFIDRWNALIKNQSEKGYKVVVVSNSAGDLTVDKDGSEAATLEQELQVPVLRHEKRKPLCYQEIREKYKAEGINPNEILVVGDRLLTDVVMANLIGAQSVWIYPGVHPGGMNKLEGYIPPLWGVKPRN